MEEVISWLEKRIIKLKEQKHNEEATANPDMEKVKRLGAKLSGYKECLTYIKSHK
jgi:hypothetical protein